MSLLLVIGCIGDTSAVLQIPLNVIQLLRYSHFYLRVFNLKNNEDGVCEFSLKIKSAPHTHTCIYENIIKYGIQRE